MQRPLAQSLVAGILCGAILLAMGCRNVEEPSSNQGPPLGIEMLAFDSAQAPRGARPFVAGETVFLALRVRGGRAPYEIQVSTSLGDPRLASASTTLAGNSEVEASPAPETSAGLELSLGSEVPSGSYVLTIRATDEDGKSASLSSDRVEVIGNDAPVHPQPEPPLHLRVVDVAGRARRSFFQGETIAIRSTLAVPQEVAIAIVASDERPFMPVQRYPPDTIDINLPLRVPRLARLGSYRVDMATDTEEASVAMTIVGTAFPAVSTPTLTNFKIYGGPKLRIPQTAVLRRGESLRIEAVVGGIQGQAKSRLRLRTRVGKQVENLELPVIVPYDTAPTARTLLQTTWTPDVDLGRGRHMLELEIEEGGRVSTLYREIVLN